MNQFATLCHRLAVGVAAASVALFVLNDHAAAHGTPFSVGYDSVTGKITVSPEVYDNFSVGEQLVFDEELNRITNDGEPGWDRANSLPLDTRLNIRFVEPLRYWNPSVEPEGPLPTPGGTIRVSTTNISAASESAPSGITGPNPRFLAQFTTHHHVSWVLQNPDAPGLYGLWASLESENLSTFNALPSDPFLIVLNYGITNSSDYGEGVDRLATTAVPEPSTLALAGVAIVAVGWRWCRRRGQRTSPDARLSRRACR